jgi:hypothetical protein
MNPDQGRGPNGMAAWLALPAKRLSGSGAWTSHNPSGLARVRRGMRAPPVVTTRRPCVRRRSGIAGAGGATAQS